MAFSLINGPAAPGAVVLALGQFAGAWLIWVVAAALTIGWLRGTRQWRLALIDTGVVVALGLGANFIIAAVWYHPRPFADGIGHQLLAHASDTSFPSDHATVLFSAAFGLFAFGSSRGWAALALVAALATAWARVWLGVHWPLDMAGSALVALLATWVALRLMRWAPAALAKQAGLRIADAALDFLRIPGRLVPRSGRSG